ncbi:hypothetical protein [Nocardioides marinquilinus]|uniref:hypothetical protein n=1 Tax=Nocardioides marinquilinus TaxID=1210400 RepID=UPI0031EFBB75
MTPAAAFIAYCALARVIDAIKVGDWLLHERSMSLAELRDLALAQQWRAGADEAIWLLEHLDGRSRSLPESEVRAMLVFAGLPAPEVNVNLAVGPGLVVQGDLLYRALRLLVEYEGAHHQEDRDQYAIDIDRYADVRRAGLEYVQVTREKARIPKRAVEEIHDRMVELGYDGPAPEFGDRWRSLFGSVAAAVGPRHTRIRAS